MIGMLSASVIQQTHDTPKLHDVSYKELVNFLDNDDTHENKFEKGIFECTNFSLALRENANKAGIRCALVYIDLSEYFHMVVGFNTTDKGMMYYDNQFGQFIKEPEVGSKYLVIIKDGATVDGLSFSDDISVQIDKVYVIW
jgi:hypothetical protein